MFSDWIDFFWKQIENIKLIQPGIFNIPWLFVSFQPLRLIGKYPALVLLQIVSFYFIYKVSRQQNLSKGRIVMVLFSAPVLWNFFMGQIDGIIIGAYLLPPTLAVLFTLFKPQTCLWAGWDGIKKIIGWSLWRSFSSCWHSCSGSGPSLRLIQTRWR